MKGCYFCHHSEANIVCSECHVARYCSTICQDKSERIFKHSTNLCPLERSPSSSALPAIQQTSSLLGVRIEHDGVTLTTPDHIPVYQWFKDYIHKKAQVSPMMDPVPVDEVGMKEINLGLGTPLQYRKSAKWERIQWLKGHQTNAERYAKTVMTLGEEFDFDFGIVNSPTWVLDFFELVTNACYKLDRNPRFFDPTKPHFYRSLTEQVWYFFESSGNNVLHRAYEVAMRNERFENKRKADTAELDVLTDELQKYKKQRVSDLTKHIATDVTIKELPYELLRLITLYLPVRTILSFLHVLEKEAENVYQAVLVTDHISTREFYNIMLPTEYVTDNNKRLMDKLEAKYDAIGKKDNYNFFYWFLMSSLLMDIQPATMTQGWWLDLRPTKSRKFATLASMASQWTLGNKGPTGILFLYYRTIGWTMTTAFLPATKLKKDPIVIVGADGLRILSEFSDTFNVHQLKMQTSPQSDIELAVAHRILELNDILREFGAEPNTRRSFEPFVSFFTFLITSVDPTITVWASLRGFENQLPPLNFYIQKTDTFTASSRLGEEQVEVMANCIKASLRYGARYEFDHNITFSPITLETDRRKKVLFPHRQSFGAAFDEYWLLDAPLRVFGLTHENMLESHIAFADESLDDDDDEDDDDSNDDANNVLIF